MYTGAFIVITEKNLPRNHKHMRRTKKGDAAPNSTKELSDYTLFLENKTHKAFQLSLEDIRVKYQAYLSLRLKPKKKTVVAFVSSKAGLNSSMELTQFDSLERALQKH